MRLLVVAFLVCACTAALSAQTNGTGLEARRAQLRDALQAEWEYTLRTHPEFATYVGDTRYNDRLGDYSPDAIAKQVEHARQQLKLFEAIDTTGFPENEALNQQLMVRELRQTVEGAKFNDWEMPVDQFNGVHLSYASMPTQMPFNTVKDYENYLARLHQLPRVLDQVTANMKLGLARPLDAAEISAGESDCPGAGDRRRKWRQEPVQPAGAEISRRDLRRRSAAPARRGDEDGQHVKSIPRTPSSPLS